MDKIMTTVAFAALLSAGVLSPATSYANDVGQDEVDNRKEQAQELIAKGIEDKDLSKQEVKQDEAMVNKVQDLLTKFESGDKNQHLTHPQVKELLTMIDKDKTHIKNQLKHK